MTPIFFLLVIWGLCGKKLKFNNKDASFRIGRTLFKIGEKNLNLSIKKKNCFYHFKTEGFK